MTLLTTVAARRRSGTGGSGEPILTPYENGGALPTSLADEAAFLAALSTLPNVTHSIIGYSVQARPIHMLRIGTGNGRPAILQGLIHGDEYGPREAILKIARDVAQSTDPAVVSFLNARSLYVIPTLSPDGHIAGTRNNANNINLNRDLQALTQPETQALAKVVRDLEPFAFHEGHDNANNQPEVEYRCTSTTLAREAVFYSALTLLQNGLIADVTAAGLTSQWYGDPIVNPTVTTTVQGAVGLAGCHTSISESSALTTTAYATKMSHQLVAIGGWLREMIETADSLDAVTTAARAEIAANAAAGGEWEIGGVWPNPGQPEGLAGYIRYSVGYSLTAAEYTAASVALECWGIPASTADGGVTYTVDLHGLETAALAVHVLDPTGGAYPATRIAP